MADNEIIKALECCGSPYNRCLECPLCETERVKCFTEMSANALNLINHQKAEIERLTELFDKYAEANKSKTLNEWLDYIRDIRAEAVREFAEMFEKKAEEVGIDEDFLYSYLEGFETYFTVAEAVKHISEIVVKEMVGNTDAETTET